MGWTCVVAFRLRFLRVNLSKWVSTDPLAARFSIRSLGVGTALDQHGFGWTVLRP